MPSFVIRVWLPDRPGALGAVASRIGSVGGDVIGIDILERGAGKAIDELVVDLPDPVDDGGGTIRPLRDEADVVALMVAEMQQVDGVSVEEVRPLADSLRDPRLDALETAAVLVGASTPEEALEELCAHAVRTIGAEWGVIVGLEGEVEVTREGDPPDLPWAVSYTHLTLPTNREV